MKTYQNDCESFKISILCVGYKFGGSNTFMLGVVADPVALAKYRL